MKAKLYALEVVDSKTNGTKQINQLVIEDGASQIGIILEGGDTSISAHEDPYLMDEFLVSRRLIGEFNLPDDFLVKAKNFIKANEELQKYHPVLITQKLL